MRIIKLSVILSILAIGLTACMKSPSKPPEVSLESLFQKVIESPPSPAEARIIGGKIDSLFSSIADIDQEYVKQISAIKWGDVYDPKSLNQKSKLPALRKVNSDSKNLCLITFEKRRKLYNEFISDLEKLSSKSIFAEAMLLDFKEKYNEAETGFLEIEKGMQESTIEKHDLIDAKLAMLLQAPGKYEMLSDGQIKFYQDARGIELMVGYTENMKKHNQLTDRQRTLGNFFVKNRQNVVNRFHELSH